MLTSIERQILRRLNPFFQKSPYLAAGPIVNEVIAIRYKLTATVFTVMFLSVVSVTKLDYLTASAACAGEHAFSFS
jgi:hypothetical protein